MIDQRQKYWGKTRELKPEVHLAEAAPDGGARFLWFAIGMPEMDEEDWRQFEVTPENARKMCDSANEAIAAGKECWINYGHDEYGRRAGDLLRCELAPDGLYGVVRWNASARAAIQQDPPEWKFFSPEFYATEVVDQDARPRTVGGRVIFQPFELSTGGSVGALTNCPAMVKLAVTAATSQRTTSPSTASPRKEQEMKISPENLALLGLAADATEEQINAAMAERLTAQPPPDPEAHAAAAEKAVDELVNGKVAEAIAKAEAEKRRADLLERCNREGKLNADNREGLTRFSTLDPDGFERLLPHLPIVSPVAPVVSGHTASVVGGSFATADLTDPDVNDQLMASAKALAASEGITIFAACERLTKKAA